MTYSKVTYCTLHIVVQRRVWVRRIFDDNFVTNLLQNVSMKHFLTIGQYLM